MHDILHIMCRLPSMLDVFGLRKFLIHVYFQIAELKQLEQKDTFLLLCIYVT